MTTPRAPKPQQLNPLLPILYQRYELSCTPAGEPFAVERSVPSVLIPLDALKMKLISDYYQLTGKTLNSETINQALNIAEAVARDRRRTLRAPVPMLRVAPGPDGCYYLDLGRADGLAVQIGSGWWKVVPAPPVLFRRTGLTGELPLPSEHGSLDRARALFNIEHPDAFALFSSCRIATLFPGITHPIELMTGPQGSAKTFTTRTAANWMDPSDIMIPYPKDAKTWATMAVNRLCLPVDNVSSVAGWWSDLLCKAVSGDGWADRALYTDAAVFVARFQSVIILNGITLGHLRGDLLDRSVRHVLARPAHYMSEDDLERIWTEVWPDALAWLLDQACSVRRMIDHGEISLVGEDRLARFSQVVRAVDRMWGTDGYSWWKQGRADDLADSAEGDTVAAAVMGYVRGPWEGTTATLLDQLMAQGDLHEDYRKPWTAQLLGDRLARAAPAMEAAGWTIMKKRSNGVRLLFIRPPDHIMTAESGSAERRDYPFGQ